MGPPAREARIPGGGLSGRAAPRHSQDPAGKRGRTRSGRRNGALPRGGGDPGAARDRPVDASIHRDDGREAPRARRPHVHLGVEHDPLRGCRSSLPRRDAGGSRRALVAPLRGPGEVASRLRDASLEKPRGGHGRHAGPASHGARRPRRLPRAREAQRREVEVGARVRGDGSAPAAPLVAQRDADPSVRLRDLGRLGGVRREVGGG